MLTRKYYLSNLNWTPLHYLSDQHCEATEADYLLSWSMWGRFSFFVYLSLDLQWSTLPNHPSPPTYRPSPPTLHSYSSSIVLLNITEKWSQKFFTITCFSCCSGHNNLHPSSKSLISSYHGLKVQGLVICPRSARGWGASGIAPSVWRPTAKLSPRPKHPKMRKGQKTCNRTPIPKGGEWRHRTITGP